MGPEPRSRADQGQPGANPQGEEPRARPEPKVKSFEIDKRLIVEAWEKVRANNGAPGVDAVGIGVFQEQLRDNLFKLWLCRVEDYAEWAVLGTDPSSSEVRARVCDSA
jgi:hypothetical protein